MECKELKKAILSGNIDISYLILTYKDTPFLANQYIKGIASALKRTVCYVDSFDALPQVDVFGSDDGCLYVFKTDKFEETVDGEYKNVIIVCKNTTCKENVVNIPTPTEEQTLDYMKIKCSGLSEDELKWLYEITKGDIYRIEREIDKISVFDKIQQNEIFNLLNVEDNYIDLSPFTIYTFITAIMKGDKDSMYKVITNLDNIDIEGTGLVTILRKNVKNLIDVKFNPSATAESLGMKPNQFMAIKYNSKRFSHDKLIEMFDFLTSIDYKLKSGKLQLSNEKLIDYILCNIM